MNCGGLESFLLLRRILLSINVERTPLQTMLVAISTLIYWYIYMLNSLYQGHQGFISKYIYQGSSYIQYIYVGPVPILFKFLSLDLNTII